MKHSNNIVKLSLDKIDLNDTYFKISRNRIDERITKSIRDLGILELPILIKQNDAYKVLFGFNRLFIIKELGIDIIDAVVLNELDHDFYIKHALIKSVRGELGPLGKIKFISILKEYFKINKDQIHHIAQKGLHIPQEFIDNGSRIKFPDILKEYIDFRDINFKVIKNLIMFPEDALLAISEWLQFFDMRVNIFKGIVELLLDIYKRDGNLKTSVDINIDLIDDKRNFEDYIYRHIFQIRYPEYSSLRKKADNIIDYFSKKGFHITFPPYFEGDTIDLKISMGKRDDLNSIVQMVNGIDKSRLRELLDLL